MTKRGGNVTRCGVIVGSLSQHSTNRQLADKLRKLAPSEWSLEPIDIAGLPLYNRDLDDEFPDPARRFKDHVEASDVLLFITPEHNRSLPAALKNALDWGPRPWGANSWSGSVGAVIGSGLSGARTAVAQAHLRSVLGSLGVTVIGAPETCIPWQDGVLATPLTEQYLQAFLDAVHAHVAGPRLHPQRVKSDPLPRPCVRSGNG